MSLPISTCTAEGVDARGIDDFVRAAGWLGVELHELVVVRHGRVAAAAHWAPWRPDVRQLVHSVSKTLVAMAVGVCVGDGQVSVEDRFVDLFPDAAPFTPGIDAITVEHLLTMTTGHTEDTFTAMLAAGDADWWRAFAAAPTGETGRTHIYHNGASTVLAEVVRRAAGRPLVDLLEERVTGPIGIDRLRWKTDALGREIGLSGAFLSAGDLALVGELLLRDGVWGDREGSGRRLLPEGWVAAMTRTGADTAYSANPHSRHGYGYQLWGAFEGFRLDGAAGQYALVLPERDAVVTLTAGAWPTQIILDLAYKHLVPALGGEVRGEPTRLTGLRVPAAVGHPVGREAAYAGVPRVIDSAPFDAPFPYPELRDPRLTTDRVLRFTTAQGPAEVACGNAVWQESWLELGAGDRVRVAARAVQDASSVAVDLAFIETPFRLTLRFLDDGDATMTWNSAIVHQDGFPGLGASQRARSAGE